MRRYNDEEKAFLREIIPGRSYAEIIAMFNARYENPITTAQVNSFIGNNKLNTGRTGRFPKGHVPHNKGKKGVRVSPATEFKKGNMPQTWKPVGTETVRSDGYTWVKVAEPNKWREKHRLIWEKANGPVPKGHAIVFGDSDKQNVDLENLVLVTRAELAMLNKFNLIGASADLTKTGILIADLRMKMHSTTKRRRPQNEANIIQHSDGCAIAAERNKNADAAGCENTKVDNSQL